MTRRFELRAVEHLYQAKQFIQYRDKQGSDPSLWWSSKDFRKDDQLAIQKHINRLDDEARGRAATEQAEQTFQPQLPVPENVETAEKIKKLTADVGRKVE